MNLRPALFLCLDHGRINNNLNQYAMKKERLQKKHCYVAPEVTVVKFAIEQGFQASLKSDSNHVGINEWNTYMNFEQENQTQNDERTGGKSLW